MAGNWIKSATAHNKGSFSAAAKKHKMSVAGFAKKVTADPDEFSKTTVKRASLAKTLRGITNKLKKA